ncbi:hypothetical protein ABT294_00795 [Nonomuraea sp. NPDC000554]|uniref:hypothetical protein n=1 Tax=Nonomuraea sp. NPDC000554 TaxID=3154259 RepID=UPI00332EE70F
MTLWDLLVAWNTASQGTLLGLLIVVATVVCIGTAMVSHERHRASRARRAANVAWRAEQEHLASIGRQALRLDDWEPDRVERIVRDALAEEATQQTLRAGDCPTDDLDGLVLDWDDEMRRRGQ